MKEVNGWEGCGGGVVWLLFVLCNEKPHGGRLMRGRSWLSLAGGFAAPVSLCEWLWRALSPACRNLPFSEARELPYRLAMMRPPLGCGFGRVPWEVWEWQLRLFPFVAGMGSRRAGLGPHVWHLSLSQR